MRLKKSVGNKEVHIEWQLSAPTRAGVGLLLISRNARDERRRVSRHRCGSATDDTHPAHSHSVRAKM